MSSSIELLFQVTLVPITTTLHQGTSLRALAFLSRPSPLGAASSNKHRLH